MNVLEFWTTHAGELAMLARQHLLLVGISTLAAIAIGLPAGVLAVRRPRAGAPLVWIANVAQTIPSLAMFGFLLPLPFVGGLGARVAITVLTIYAVLPIVRTTAAGLRSVDPALVDTAIALGMTGRQRLWRIEMPLALPSIVAGIRVAAVIAVGTATIAAAVGAGGLGEYIFRGLSMVDPTVVLAGAIPAAALALLFDGGLTLVERGIRRALTSGHAAARRLVPAVLVALVASGTLLVVSALPRDAREVVRIGSKNFTEQIILGELLAQTLEARTSLQVERRLNLGGTFICDRALRAGDIDMYVEYTGTAYAAILDEPPSTDPAHVLETVRRRYAEAHLTLLPPLGFENTFAILVRGADARRLGLETISDAAPHARRWTAGFGYEFLQRADGLPGLMSAYNLRFDTAPRAMDLSLIYRALADGQVDLIAGDATSGLIEAYDLHMLGDDRRYFPPYDAVVVARSPALLAHPRARDAVASLSGRITLPDMRRLNHQVDALRRDPAVVVREFLAALGRGD